jgi:NADPH:quinone reductase-like Zn-dependent oxidoreductase
VDCTGDVPATVTALRPNGIHTLVHLAGDGLKLTDLVIPGDRTTSTAGLPPAQLRDRAVRAMPVTAVPDSRTLDRLADSVLHGELTIPIQRTYQLADVPLALADLTAGTRGKLAITVA